ncbi:hypothetical protein FQR65_LT02391 [Abscondita terminalis]|nr:hypothetical protein FQR65_LT02391 [Abscondita terminalis]
MDKRANIVEQILEQGQRLRNAMVKSILDNDPFYIEDARIKQKLESNKPLHNKFKTIEDDKMCKFKTAKSTQVMSSEFPEVYCGCHICNIYKREIYFGDKCMHIPPLHLLKRTQNKCRSTDNADEALDSGIPSRSNLQSDTVTSNFTEDKIQSINQQEHVEKPISLIKTTNYFKYVDSMKIMVHNVSLNYAGNRKALASGADTKYRLPISTNQSYFVEYNIPNCLTHTLARSKSKVDSGLGSNLFRVCSKKLQDEEIFFKHTSIHDIVNFQQLNLSTIELKFQISTRAMKQKRSNILGNATFNMRLFEITKNMSCTEHLPIISDDFVLGTLKITVQLGCGRIYFGKEFVEFIENNRKDSVSIATQKTDVTLDTPSSQTVNSVIFQPNRPPERSKSPHKISKAFNSDRSSTKSVIEGNIIDKEKHVDNEGLASSFGTLRSDLKIAIENGSYSEEPRSNCINELKVILYGLIYVSEAKYFEGPINSYFNCQAFCLGDTLCSRVVYNSKDPVFNFYQKLPFVYDESFLNYLRDSSIIIDFWERYEDEDIAIGTSQLSLYQFYVTYRNSVITNTLLQNRLPVTIADWWEPICSPVDGKLYGQMKVLVAIGTANQIQNLEVERGLKNESFSVTYVPIVPETKGKENNDEPITDRTSVSLKKPAYLKPKKIVANTKESKTVPVKTKKETCKTVDKAVQSVEQMESQNSENPDNASQNDALKTLLTQLMEEKRKSTLVESATNTDAHPSVNGVSKEEKNLQNVNLDKKNAGFNKTYDLMNYLNGLFDSKTLDSKITTSAIEPKEVEDCFKAHITIEGALHLPSRRKCKVKKNKRKNVTYEDSLPCTYVSFDTVPGADLKYTDVVPRSTNPQWDFASDVLLPADMLVNNQKRLIFKVWRKNNMNSLQPNPDTDVILGFAALDLTVLLAGLPSVQGWFNIVDFSSKCNGQIKIHVTPLENITKFSENKITSKPQTSSSNERPNLKPIPVKLEPQEPPGELLSRALKRKFTELEEITQRLRSRLADVTKEDSDTSNDEFADEFEKDLNTLSIEEDYDMLDLKSLSESSNLEELRPFSESENGSNNFLLMKANTNEPSIYSTGILRGELFSKGALSDSAYGSTHADNSNFNVKPSSTRPREKQVLVGKQHIDSLLEKLTLLTGSTEENAFSSRYVSGCSTNQDGVMNTNSDDVSNESEPRRGFNLDSILNPELFNQLCSSAISPPTISDSDEVTDKSLSSNSLLTQFVNYRQAPDGAGLNTSSNSSSSFNNGK